VGIPEYRLPREPLNAEIDNIRRAGVEIRCNQSLGVDFTVDELLDRDGFSGVILAIGAHKSRKLGIPGEDCAGVVHGTDFLRAVALMEAGSQKLANPESLVSNKRIAIIGGGNAAMDVARTAWRMGASEVHVVYRRRREAMPAYAEEVKAGLDEGIQYHFLANPVRVLSEPRGVGESQGRVTGLEIRRQRLGDFDESGRRRPVPLQDDPDASVSSVYTLDVDVVIPAIGHTTDTSWIGPGRSTGIEASRSGTLVVNQALATTRPGVFAAGDAVIGPATVVEAVAQGNLVAVAVDHWLQTAEYAKPRYETQRPDIAQLYNLDDYANALRPHAPELELAERQGTFEEVELGLDEQMAREEAKRCLRCDLEWMDYVKIPRPVAAMHDNGH